MKRPDALFLDIDGTILKSDHTLSPRVAEAVKNLSNAGTLVCLATGRSWQALKPLYDALGLTGPTVCYNGAMIVEGPGGSVVFEKDMDETAARAAVREARFRGIELVAYRHASMVFERPGPEVDKYIPRVAVPGQQVDFDSLDSLKFTKCIFIAEPERLKPLKELMEGLFGADKLSCTYSDRRFLEMMGGGIDKGRGLLEVCRIHGIDPARAAAMGDGWNDLHMLEAAGEAWVMDGASDDLKALFPSDRVAPHSDRDGAALVMEEMLRRDSLEAPRAFTVTAPGDGAGGAPGGSGAPGAEDTAV